MSQSQVKKWGLLLISLLVVGAMVLGACAPQAAPAAEKPAEQPKPTEAPKQEAKPVEPPKEEAKPTEPPKEEPKAEPKGDKTLVIAVSADIAGWDPAATQFWLANEVAINTHDTLVDYAAGVDEAGNPVRDVNKLVPSLAESWKVSDDGMTVTFNLRKDVKFNNGDPCNAQAVKASFTRIFDIPSLSQFLLTSVAMVTKPEQIETPDEYTVVFKLPQPTPMFLKVMQEMNMSIVNAALIEKEGGKGPDGSKWASNHITGTGPYVLEEFKAGEQLVLSASPTYWGPKPEYTKIIYRVVPEVENRLAMLDKGDVDIVYEPPLKDYEAYKSKPNIKLYATPTFGNLHFWVGRNLEPWKSNIKLRQALLYAIPYQTIIDEVTYGYAKPAKSWLPEGLAGYIPASPYTYDLEKAKALLAEAGYPEGKGLPPIKFYLKQGNPEEEQVIVYIQAELASIGVKMDIEKLSLAAHSEKQSKHELPFTFNFWIPYVPDPVYHFYWNYRDKDSGFNLSRYENPEMDKLIDQGLVELDADKRAKLIEEVQKIIAQDPDKIIIYHPSWNVAMKSGIKGYTYYPDTLLRFAQLTSE